MTTYILENACLSAILSLVTRRIYLGCYDSLVWLYRTSPVCAELIYGASSSIQSQRLLSWVLLEDMGEFETRARSKLGVWTEDIWRLHSNGVIITPPSCRYPRGFQWNLLGSRPDGLEWNIYCYALRGWKRELSTLGSFNRNPNLLRTLHNSASIPTSTIMPSTPASVHVPPRHLLDCLHPRNA